MKRLGAVLVTNELLASVLRLGEGCRIVRTFEDSKAITQGGFWIIVEGETMPEVPEGMEIPWVALAAARETEGG